MLPVDSPKWSELMCDLGSAQPIADALKEAYEIVKAADGDQAQINQAVSIASGLIGDLYHQQSTYSGTAAAIPHLVHFAELANLKQKSYILVMIAYMNYDHAGSHAPDELDEAYSDAVNEACAMATHLLQHEVLTKDEQESLFETVAFIRGTCFNAIQYQGEGIKTCTGCKADLMVSVAKDGFEISFEDGDSVPVQPVQDLAIEFKKPRHRELAYYFKIAQVGKRDLFLDWLSNYLGTFVCPACKTEQQIDYER